jgi:hypothetical protein
LHKDVCKNPTLTPTDITESAVSYQVNIIPSLTPWHPKPSVSFTYVAPNETVHAVGLALLCPRTEPGHRVLKDICGNVDVPASNLTLETDCAYWHFFLSINHSPSFPLVKSLALHSTSFPAHYLLIVLYVIIYGVVVRP